MSENGTLTSTTLSGLDMGGKGITYSGVSILNISLGSGADSFNILSTSSGNHITLNAINGSDVINIGSLAPERRE